MPRTSRPRYGSLQFWPRKRARRLLPRVNWDTIQGKGILGCIAYKAGMATVFVKDAGVNSMTKGRRISLPATILEIPPMRIYSIRFYKNGKVAGETVVVNDKELRRRVRVAKTLSPVKEVSDADEIRLLIYSHASQTRNKKVPDIIETVVRGEGALEYVSGLIGKDLGTPEAIKTGFVDVHGVTKGKGLSGPVARFGISLRQHKSEKGIRNPGSLGPWHPARVTFRTPMSGQLGMFSRVHYNLPVITSSSPQDKNAVSGKSFMHYGPVTNEYLIVKGSVQGPPKRAVILTPAARLSKKQKRTKYEFIEIA